MKGLCEQVSFDMLDNDSADATSFSRLCTSMGVLWTDALVGYADCVYCTCRL